MGMANLCSGRNVSVYLFRYLLSHARHYPNLTPMITARLLLYSAIVFFILGSLAFAAVIWTLWMFARSKRHESRRFDVSPVSKLGGEK